MKDRVSLYPGRVKLTQVSGQENTYDMVRADEPTQEGDPLSKATFLKDDTAALFGLDAAAVPDDVFAKLSAKETISNLVIERIYSSQDWVAPKVYNQLFKVFAVGGGGAGYAGSSSSPGGGGGSGFINIQNVTVPQGETVSIMCGAGGASSGADGGDTLFGDYLTANGGKGATTSGGDGEAGGGGTAYGAGGNGSVFGGGGGNGGNGGTYGGGGGGGGIGGTYGGNGGTSDNLSGTAGAAFAGTILSTLYPLRLSFPFDSSGGSGHSGYSSYGGGGGYGGPGGSAGGGRHGGGGGYGGKGGSPGGPFNGGGGGGGGYGGNGGNGACVSNGVGGGGGAGGFFCNGGSASSYNGGGGGGFFSDGSGITGGNGGVLIMYFKEETA